MDLQLNGRQALVSGSTAGMGYAMAEALVHDVARRGGFGGGAVEAGER
jgi:NAD(P)-dependent dehydrogenase (short-subunit alcohol dehydrogenase family)